MNISVTGSNAKCSVFSSNIARRHVYFVVVSDVTVWVEPSGDDFLDDKKDLYISKFT